MNTFIHQKAEMSKMKPNVVIFDTFYVFDAF